MSINFPNSPSNGQTLTSGGKTYTYDSAKTVWKSSKLSGLDSGQVVNILNANAVDSAVVTSILSTSSDVLDSATVISLVSTNSNKVFTVANITALGALTGMSTGDQALVTGTSKLYMYNGTGWYLIATITNASPSAITGVDSSYTLAIDGTATVINAIATDPEGLPLTWSSSDSGLSDIATITQGTGDSSNYFTITPASSDSTSGGTFTLTIGATDGVNGAVNWPIGFTLSFVVFDSGVSLQHQWGGTDTAFYGANATLSDDGMYLAISSLGTGAESAGHIDIWISNGTTNSWTHQTTIDWNDFNSAFSGTTIGQNNNTFGRFKMQLNNDGSRLMVSNPYANISSGISSGFTGYRGTIALLSRSGTTWSFVQGTSNSTLPLAPSVGAEMYGGFWTAGPYGNQSAMANGTGNNNGQVIAAHYTYNGNADTTPWYIEGNVISIYKYDRTDGKINNTSFQNIDFRTATNNTFVPRRGQANLALSANGEWLAIGYYNTHQTGQSFASTTWNAADYHRGVVYLYKSTNTSTRTDYTQQQYILGPTGHNGSSGGKFGRRVEMSDSGTLLVHQNDGDHSTISGALGVGRVYIYTVSGSTWSQLQILEAPTTGTGSNAAPYTSNTSIETFHSFGHNMAISGDASYIAISDSDSKPDFESIIHIYKINGSNTYDLLDTITSNTNNTYHAEQFYFDNNMLSITSNGFLSFGIPNSDKHDTNDGQVTVYKHQ